MDSINRAAGRERAQNIVEGLAPLFVGWGGALGTARTGSHRGGSNFLCPPVQVPQPGLCEPHERREKDKQEVNDARTRHALRRPGDE